MQAPDFSIKTLHEFMKTEEIFSAWDDLTMAISILREACDIRLKELGYYDYTIDGEDDTDNLSEGVERLLDLRETLDSINV